MDTTTAREFNQRSSHILAAAESGRTIRVFKNGRHVATVIPADQDPLPAYPLDAMGEDPTAPVFDGPGDLVARTDEYMEGFGR
ncbi:type II toxin-antitoxin system prevent-host-death family antitoxin [Streptomyces sp. WMMC500]|uniref:type II toxin-antitoxin system Phd/YefM family antitoxin n=1 Tax=Streptomyces sp. WMMC500 TaxID=3015154 RepID=UPI00248C5743|nr:type II toxin-antitoxin system prevent-host-death family antitoxin [Streptomyces sp. WMMC500]WBB58089.1 type II toxin-antitoxin system prevent-host-death family antitoxin [Streptomyces sp. WMMC500]